jgi:hypothetical protein
MGQRQFQFFSLVGFALMLPGWVGVGSTVLAAEVERDPSKFNIEQFQAGFCDENSFVEGVRDRIPEDSNDPAYADPSLWLGRDIFAYQARFGKKIFEGWLVCPSRNSDRGRIDVVVNGQLWSVLDYFDRYELVQQFGISSDRADAKSRSGYNLRVFNRQGRSLGSYTCNGPVFGSVPVTPVLGLTTETPTSLPSTRLPKCSVKLDDANNGLGVRNRS